MATYAVGDIQGCFDGLIALLKKLKFNWQNDKLWFCGDLINRGSQSLNTLRYLYEHRERIKVVLGNHDLHMLAVANGAESLKFKDTFQKIIDEPRNQDLVEWLYRQPLAHYSNKHKTLMVHAAISAKWSLKQTLACSDEVTNTLCDSQRRADYFKAMYGDTPDEWNDQLKGNDRLRYITNVFTRTRFVYHDGRLELGFKSAPGDHPKDLMPWYDQPLKIEKDIRIVFGHWAALQGKLATKRFQALDTGYVWGGTLTALNLSTGERTFVSSR
ncbi:symmetrical bis(5'-nucleosyl)-tetraphosphatase [Pleionea sediminis]|uniref:symmetrical bis(5'-nucleosyl)-tetraphosphatase n=1 Tax=Pleionea sediminis TaxID=2569479 RepID=UPI0011849C21|nr:symmetrical bis(5'-nucleosyl)-tetraphosphatase [Pleionea sediminis]